MARERELETFKASAQQFEQRTAAAIARLEERDAECKESFRVRDIQGKRIEEQDKTIVGTRRLSMTLCDLVWPLLLWAHVDLVRPFAT